LYTKPKLNLNNLPKGINEKEDGVGLKQPQQILNRKDYYMKTRINNYFSFEKRCCLRGNMPLDVVVQTLVVVRWEEAFKRERDDPLRHIAKNHKDPKESTRLVVKGLA
jgi:hypothetical protein